MPKFDKRPYHFGFGIGFNKYDFSIKTVPNVYQKDSLAILESTPQWGFNISLLANLRLGNHLDLRFTPTLSFGSRNLNYSFIYNDSTSNRTKIKAIESSVIDFPLSIKYKSARVNNFRAYMLGGIKYSIDMASQAKKDPNNKELVKIKKNDVAFELGFGLDIYFDLFKLSPEIKFSVGLNDLIVRENTPYTRAIDKLTSKVLFINFYFE